MILAKGFESVRRVLWGCFASPLIALEKKIREGYAERGVFGLRALSDMERAEIVYEQALNGAGEVVQYIPGWAFYPAGMVCKIGKVPLASRPKI